MRRSQGGSGGWGSSPFTQRWAWLGDLLSPSYAGQLPDPQTEVSGKSICLHYIFILQKCSKAFAILCPSSFYPSKGPAWVIPDMSVQWSDVWGARGRVWAALNVRTVEGQAHFYPFCLPSLPYSLHSWVPTMCHAKCLTHRTAPPLKSCHGQKQVQGGPN